MKGWKVYKDTDLGYSIKYPSDWTLYDDSRPDVAITAPGEEAMFKKNAGGPGGGPALGCEFFSIRVSDKKAYNQEFTSSLSLGGVYGVQDTILNGMKAKFYIEPVMCEKNVWAIQRGDKVFIIAVRTASDLFGSETITPDDYLSAVNSANTFTLNK